MVPPSSPSSSSTISDSKSCVSGFNSGANTELSKNPSSRGPKLAGFNDEDVVRLEESDRAHGLIKHKLTSSLGIERTEVIAIHKKKWTSILSRARFHAFEICCRACASKYGGGGRGRDDSSGSLSNYLKYAWFGSSKSRIERIMAYGFSHEEVFQNNGLFGRGIYLSPDDSPMQSLESAAADGDGTRHLLFCRVLIGRSETVRRDSDQSYPSSTEFDSGIDSAMTPKNYIIWTANMNTHILPEYVVSIRTRFYSSAASPPSSAGRGRVPSSPWMPLPVLISTLAKVLSPESVDMIRRYHKQFKEKRISRQEIIQRVRHIAGDKLLSTIIKSAKGVSSYRATCVHICSNQERRHLHGVGERRRRRS